MGNAAAQACCCERRPLELNRARSLQTNPSLRPPVSPRQGPGQDECRSSSSSWPFPESDAKGTKDAEAKEAKDEAKEAKMSQMRAADLQAEEKVKALEASATKVIGNWRKFPTSGMGWGSAWLSKERFFAVVPAKADVRPRSGSRFDFLYEGGDKARSGSAIDKLRSWRNGSLKYWKSLASFEKKEDPQGIIPLLGITKVYIDEENKSDVIVKYTVDSSSEPVKLHLSFPSYMSAEQWRKELRNIRATL